MPVKKTSAEHRSADRKFSVSANRSEARHRIRYVETGGAAVDDGECVFCDTTPDLDGSTNSCKVDGAKPPIPES